MRDDEAARALDGAEGSRSVSVSVSSQSPQPQLLQAPSQTSQTHTLFRATPARAWLSSVRRPKTSPGPKNSAAFRKALLAADDSRRDSALASAASTQGDPIVDDDHRSFSPSLRRTPSLPAITVQDEGPSSSDHTSLHSHQQDDSRSERDANFIAIDTIIPTGGLDDLTSPNQVSFSKRGSMLLGGKRANKMKKQLGQVKEPDAATPELPTTPQATPPRQKEPENSVQNGEQKEHTQKPQQQLSAPDTPATPATSRLSPRSISGYSVRRRAVSQRILSTDETMLSRKVRTMYKHGNESAANWDGLDEEGDSVQNCAGSSVAGTPLNGSSLIVEDTSSMRSSRRESIIVKEPTEVAGGVEDWTDIEGGEVDRYGFILPKKTGSRGSSNGEDLNGPDEPRIQRLPTLLKLVSEEPRKRNIGRSASKARSAKSANPKSGSLLRKQSLNSSRPQGSIFSTRTNATRRPTTAPFRQATIRLPHNRDRRLLEEASDMLKLPPGLAELAEQAEGGRAAQAMKQKEIEREEKWRKMAKVVQSGAKSGGMMFEFDVKDSKITSRTWKGIPDRWRGTAWYAFLAASAKAAKDSPSEEELIESFYELQEESSADDMQIDVDVPRTINRHIMFRRRYRGGQRLLFRVLHAMSLYLPETGYVQGMAALAATLLCYYEEDKAFVMLVRLWMHRGLERLYEKGFIGLMEALKDFEDNWLRNGDVAKKLTTYDIPPMTYATRWYLTLFNYSLPFAAQLRVWDVFMLLGDASHSSSPNSTFSGDLDVLHATSAALIDATREIILDSDFENTMKVLTSWIPIKDEDLLMRVAKAEYKMRKKRGNSG